MKLLKFLIPFLFFAISCSDSKNELLDDSETPPITNNEEAEKQIDEVIDALSQDEELSDFTNALKAVDSKTLEAKEFTLLAYKNKLSEKAFATVKDEVDADIMRHMVSGKYTFEQLRKLDKLVALSKDTLYINNETSDVIINGVTLGKPIEVDNSIVFLIDSIIPIIKDSIVAEDRYQFIVYNINTNWTTGQSDYKSVASGVQVNIYEEGNLASVVETVNTDTSGVVSFSYKKEAKLFFEINNGESYNTFQGYVVNGLFTSESELVTAPNNTIFTNVLGGLKLADLNGDGMITIEDKVDMAPLSFETDTVYLVPESFIPNVVEEDFSLANISNLFWNAKQSFARIDYGYSTKIQRQGTNSKDSTLNAFWNESYRVIKLANNFLQDSIISLSQVREMRADLYFNLATSFNKVPLQLNYPLNPQALQNTQKEVYQFVEDEYNDIFDNISDSLKVEVYLKQGLLKRSEHNYAAALDNFKKGVEAVGNLHSYIANDTDRQLYLLSAEMCVETNKLQEATDYVNTLYAKQGMAPVLPSGGATEKKIMEVVQRDLNNLDAGLIFLNIKCWEEVSTWGQYEFLPIPYKAIEASKGKLKQNSGW